MNANELTELLRKKIIITGDGHVVGKDNTVTIIKQVAGDYAIQIGLVKVNLSVDELRQLLVNQVDPKEAKAQFDAIPLDTIPPITTLPHGSRLPFRPNPHFVGREEELKRVAKALKEGTTVAVGQTVAATGLGGIGKTQLVVEFAHRYGCYFSGGVFWLNFFDPDAVLGQMANCGGLEGMALRPDFDELKLEEQVKLVQQAWRKSVPRLLIFDACEDENLLARWRPSHGGCRVLVTSRRGRWSPTLGVSQLVLDVLDRAESIELLRKFQPDLSEADASAIAEELGDLPLALHLAGSFLAKYGRVVTPDKYLSQLRDKTLLDHPSLKGRGAAWSPTEHELNVARTFQLSYERLEATDETDKLAQKLLARAAYFAPAEPIPHDLLLSTLDLDNSDLEAMLLAEDGLTRLVELGLVDEGQAGAIRLHQLVGEFVKDVINDLAAQVVVGKILIMRAEPLNEFENPMPLRILESHLRYTTTAVLHRADAQTAKLCGVLGEYLRISGQYIEARSYLEQALAIREQVLGSIHPETAQSLNHLGELEEDTGNLSKARAYHERALAIKKRVLGPEHPDTAISFNYLGILLWNMGDMVAARPYLEKALAIREHKLEPNNPHISTSLHNLGILLYTMGDLNQALEYFKRALVIEKQVHGPDHPYTATTLNNLGQLYKTMGDLTNALLYYEQALKIREHTLGPEHPRTATSFNSLGLLFQAKGDFAKAYTYYERGLEIRKRVQGADHPDTAISLNNIGELYQITGNLAKSQSYLEEALAIWQQALGPNHYLTALGFEKMGDLFHQLGDLVKARTHYKQALIIREQALGSDHLHTGISLNKIGTLLVETGKLSEARPYLERALAIREEKLGPDHPDTQETRHRLKALGTPATPEQTAPGLPEHEI